MNVCILTMIRVDNYGSVFQAYALKTILESMGHEVSFIDIESSEEEYNRYLSSYKHIYEQNYKVTGFKRYLHFDRYFYNRISHKLHSMINNGCGVFDKFRSEVLSIREPNTANREQFDVCIIGSDEMFNCLSERLGYVSQMFGNVPQAAKVVSYAASCGFASYEDTPDEMRLEIAAHLNNMRAISVRDHNSADFVSGLIGNTPYIHLDPVLIYDFSKEKNNAKRIKIPHKYCLVYAYGNRINDKNEIDEIEKFCKKEKLTLISAGGPQDWITRQEDPDPFQLLSLFENAAFVITDTFHGTIFSFKYAERFAVILRDSNRNKLGDLVGRLGIESHVISDVQDIFKAYSLRNDTKKNGYFLAEEKRKTVKYLEATLSNE